MQVGLILNENSMPTMGTPIFSIKKGSTPWLSGPGQRKMESPSRLGLGTINIAPLRGRTSLTIRVWVQSLGMEMGRC